METLNPDLCFPLSDGGTPGWKTWEWSVAMFPTMWKGVVRRNETHSY